MVLREESPAFFVTICMKWDRIRAMSRLTLNLPDDIASELADAGAELHLTPEAAAEDMIRRMIALRRIDRLRRDVREATDSTETEDEILDRIS